MGHLTLGAGRIVLQEAARITRAINDGAFYKNKVLKDGFEYARKNNSSVHLIGLLSDAGVHSLIEHLFALIDMAKREMIKDLWIHVILDGRDTPQKSAMKYLDQLLLYIKKKGVGKIATIIGRYYAMDRDKRWERTEKAYNAMYALTPKIRDIKNYIKESYKKGITDEFIKPVAVNGYMGLQENDVVIFYNFRNDRPRQICHALVDKKFGFFKRKRKVEIKLITMTHYDDTLNADIAFKPVTVKNCLSEWISKHNLSQLHAAESEKYAHVTFFFNGGREKPFKKEKRIVLSSPKVATYDLKPEMSAYALTINIVKELNKKLYDVVLVNYANPDMVGHTGNYKAAIKAVETVDICLSVLVQELLEKGYLVVITADHGNCEEMYGKHKTSHTLNPVFFTILGNYSLEKRGGLCNVAPTILELMNLPLPREMKCKSLIKH